MKKKKNNRKGFTLIELLAVIVVLAIVLVVTIPSVISSMNNAKLSQLHNLAVSVAQWYDRSADSDNLGIDKNILGNYPLYLSDGEWHCLSYKMKKNEKPLAKRYDLNKEDIKLSGDAPNGIIFTGEGESDDDPAEADYCSAIKIENGKAIVYLVAEEGGKFDARGETLAYALSSGTKGFNTFTG